MCFLDKKFVFNKKKLSIKIQREIHKNFAVF